METKWITTAFGCGTWGNEKYKVELVKVVSTYAQLNGPISKTVTDYMIRFKPDGGKWDSRTFDSAQERQNFIDESFCSLHLKETMDEVTCKHPLINLVDDHLSAVCFVSDYLELDFSGQKLAIYYWPQINFSDGRVVIYGDRDYRNQLCSFIEKKLVNIDEYLDAGLVLKFEDGSFLEILLDVIGQCPEIAVFSSTNAEEIIVWQVGDKPFAQ